MPNHIQEQSARWPLTCRTRHISTQRASCTVVQSSCRYFNNLKGGTNVRALLKQYGSESKHSNHKRHLTVMNKWIKTSSEDRYRHRFTWLLHIIPKQYMKKNWGQTPTSNLILIYSYLMQDNSYRGAVSTRILCTSGFRTGCSDLSTFTGFCEAFVHYTNLYENWNSHATAQEPVLSNFTHIRWLETYRRMSAHNSPMPVLVLHITQTTHSNCTKMKWRTHTAYHNRG